MLKDTVKKRKLYLSNIQNIPVNVNVFMSYTRNMIFDVSDIGFWKTWLDSLNTDTYGIDGYNHIGLTWEMGGVLLLICDVIAYWELSKLDMVCKYIEYIFF